MSSKENIPVLIVDDRPENLTALEALLADLGVEVAKALSGNEALRQALYGDFALVLLDVQMPEMDGFETAELLRENPKTRHLPIIFVTAGMKEDHHLFKGYEAGAVDYLMKPIEPAILRSKVRVFCDLFSQRRELKKIQAELEQQNARLRETYRELEAETAERVRAVEELRQRDQVMIQQNRAAAMGDMLNNIAHHWRQPLNVLGLKIQEIGMAFEHGELTSAALEVGIEKAMDTLRQLSQTIDDFREFSAPDREKTRFSVDEILGKTVSVIRDGFLDRGIDIEVSSGGDTMITGYPKQYRQALLSILMNARDAFGESWAGAARIMVKSWSERGDAVVTITDNAGGIKEEILGRIFDAYFTTKELGKGSGIGLFMARHIIERQMGGRLSARNVDGGAEFRIEVPLASA